MYLGSWERNKGEKEENVEGRKKMGRRAVMENDVVESSIYLLLSLVN